MPNPIHDPRYTIFREMLVEMRQSLGLLQSEVAERLNKNQSFVSKYERGERRIDFPEFVDIAGVMNINVAEFVKQYLSRLKNSR